MSLIHYSFLIVSISFLLMSCRPQSVNAPRPHQYPRIIFPTKEYIDITIEECPFTFQAPRYCNIEKKEYLFEDIPAGKCWFDIECSIFNAKIHCSYFPINDDHNFTELVNDAFEMASKHNIKASFREEMTLTNNSGSGGIIFSINGPVATPYQFFITDSISHFLRGSLYFDQEARSDSLSPIIEYLYSDIETMLSTIVWNY